MALQEVLNKFGIHVKSVIRGKNTSIGSYVVDAVGESGAFIGKVFLEGGSGSKTISSAGGAIWIDFGSATWASATTKVRVGIQDVNASGVEDGTFDVYKECTGGTGDLTASALNKISMASGTKTIAHGDVVAVVVEMTARGGTDAVRPSYAGLGDFWSYFNFPYSTSDSGSGPTRSAGIDPILIVFDDGTLGWFAPFFMPQGLRTEPSVLTYNTGSNPDEYAAMFKFPFKCSVRGFGLFLSDIGASDTFDIILYSDPLGTPVAEYTYTPDVDLLASTTADGVVLVEITEEELAADTWYAVALRARSANSVGFGYFNYGAGGEKYKKGSPFGVNIKLVGRQDQSGAFSEVQNYYMPILDLLINKLDDGVQTGGGASSHVF